ncbi:MarR family transcriptional regulator [Clostridium neuense]|uniref:MarR family transcriptional regulator n=2 Tax=Clostridium neuense TaxID=1728934 RepID=A0ABW8TJL2_9CLOT
MDSMINENKISCLFLEVVCNFYENDMKAKKFGTDTDLYHSEIHMLEFIKENRGLNISGIARKLDITRGAVSQTIKRLEDKGFICKEPYRDTSCRFSIKLTEKGEIAYSNHKKYHEQYNIKIAEILKNSTAEEKNFLYQFLKKFKGKI